jgi:hypothetical protein
MAAFDAEFRLNRRKRNGNYPLHQRFPRVSPLVAVPDVPLMVKNRKGVWSPPGYLRRNVRSIIYLVSALGVAILLALLIT